MTKFKVPSWHLFHRWHFYDQYGEYRKRCTRYGCDVDRPA